MMPRGEAGPAGSPDAALVTAAREDPQQFLPLYQRYVGRIYRYCFVRLRDRAAAEDATSEVFYKAIEKLESYRGGMFAAWLFAIARNVVNDRGRRRDLLTLDEVLDVPALGLGPEGDAVIRVQREALYRALAELSQPQRSLMELQLAGWKDAEIADAMDKSRDAIKMLRLRTFKRLRQVLPRHGWSAADWEV